MNTCRSIAGVAVSVVLLATAMLAVAPGLRAEQALAQGEPVPGTITVVGEGTAKIMPDVAQATIGVEFSRPTVIEASDDVRSTMRDVMAALKQQGVADKDMKTSGFSVWTEQSYADDRSLASISYRASNQVIVTIRDIESAGKILDAAMTAGANSIYGISFDLEDQGSAQSDAREAAVANAKEKASDLAELTGLRLGDVVSVSEVIGNNGFFSGISEAAMGRGGGEGNLIYPGEMAVTVQLQIVYSTVQ